MIRQHRDHAGETEQAEVEAAARLRERYLSSWLALAGEQMEVQLFDNPWVLQMLELY